MVSVTSKMNAAAAHLLLLMATTCLGKRSALDVVQVDGLCLALHDVVFSALLEKL